MSEEHPAERGLPKPPLGLVPRFIRDEQRLAEIDAAIGRYVAALYPIPGDWLRERDALTARELLSEGVQA